MAKTEVVAEEEETRSIFSSYSGKEERPVRAPGPVYYGTSKYAVRTPNKAVFGVKKNNNRCKCLMMLRELQKIPTQQRSMRVNLGEIAGYMITESEKDEIVKREREEMLKERKEAAATKQKQESLRREKELKRPAESSNNVHPFRCRSEKRSRSSGIQINEKHQENEEDEFDDGDFCCRPKKRPKTKKPKTEEFSKAGQAQKGGLPNPLPSIPPKLLQTIRTLNGQGETLVTQKVLYKSDVEPQHHRFSIPLNSIRKETFLTPEEVKLLETRVDDPVTKKSNPGNMEVTFIDPELRQMDMNFRLWEYGKEGKKSSWSYVFVTYWMEVVRRNHLHKGLVVQVWAFRVKGNLCFAMHVVNSGEEAEEESNGF